MDSITATVGSQYQNSPRLMGLLTTFNAAIDQTANIDLFFNDLWNIETAVGYGLDVLGRIVGVARVLQVADTQYIGFAEAVDGSGSAQPFNQGIFYSGAPTTSNYALTDDAFRTLILAKAAANITDGSIVSINSILMALFSDSGQIWVVDNLDMTMTIEFDWALTAVQAAIIEQSGVLPRPSGVSITYSQATS